MFKNDRPGYTDLASAQERELEIMVSDEFARLMSKAVITMYSAILHEAPDAQFSHMASGAVTQDNRNPEQVYRRMLAMLTQLSDRAQQVETSDHPLAQLIRRGEKKRIVIGANGGAKEIIVPAVEFIDSGVSEFAQYLREILEASRGMVEYGHNFRFQMQQFQSGVDQGGTPNLFLKQVAAHAKRELPSERLDTISRLDHTGELVEAARMKYASKFQQLFSAREWRRTPDLVIRELMRSDTRLEEEIRGELEEQYGDTVEPWLLSWAYTMARTEFMGIDFGYHQTTSYADPNLDKDGKPTFTAEDAYQAILNFGDDAMRLQIKPVLLAGAMWAPVLYDWRQWRFNHDDVERIGKRSFQDSFKMGKLAKMGTPIEGYDLYMELGNKLTRRGGFFTNSGSALTGTYQEWIRDVLDPGSDGKKMAYSRDSLAQGWKCLENIGVDVLRNYFETFALGEIKDGTSMSDKAPEPSEKYVTAMKGLAGFLWDRYVEPNNDIAKTAFGDAPVDSKGSFVNYVGEILTSGGTEYKLRRKELMSRVYAGIEAIMIFEQLPSTYLTIEKRRVSEYGVLLSERIRSSITAPTGQAAEFERTYGVDSTDEEQWFRWYRTAVADLAFVEEALRMATSKEMDQILLEQGNLYGNLDNTRSSIRQGKGNRIDIDYIEQTLRARFTASTRITPEERDRRIKATLLLYSRLKEQVGHVPTVSDVLSNKAIAALGDKKKLADIDDKTIRKEQAARYAAILEKAQSGRMNSPIGWLAGGIQDGTFGFSLTSQTIPLRYLHMSASGSDTISKTALQTASTAELQYRMGGFSLWGGAKKALGALGKDPEEAFKAIFEYVNAAKGPSSDYLDSATVGTVGLAYLDLFQLFLRQDDKYARSVPARIDYEAKDKKRSFSDNTVADGAKLPASMGIYEQHALGIAATESGVLPYYKSANGEQWRTLNLNHPTLSRIPGLKNYLARHVRVRDFAREQSAESRGRAHSASEREYELYVYLPFLLLFFANFIFGAIKNGIKELKIG
ncbi:MAG: hypothetical protein UZ21_OP11001000557 [Microgenomates bacterium OLB22]|nr:MAG: hypothetical protein UZ21_OP11001000557 [Microgenomates bacterium OLB22]